MKKIIIIFFFTLISLNLFSQITKPKNYFGALCGVGNYFNNHLNIISYKISYSRLIFKRFEVSPSFEIINTPIDNFFNNKYLYLFVNYNIISRKSISLLFGSGLFYNKISKGLVFDYGNTPVDVILEKKYNSIGYAFQAELDYNINNNFSFFFNTLFSNDFYRNIPGYYDALILNSKIVNSVGCKVRI